MSLPRACADCGDPLDYRSGHWQNVAPQGSRERIVCRRCWRLNHRKPPPVVTSDPAAEAAPAPPVDSIIRIVAACRALVARAARQEAKSETQRELARWRSQ